MAKKPTYKDLENRIQRLEKKAAEFDKMEKALAESQDRFEGFFEDSPIATFELDCTRLKTYIDDLRKEGIKNFNLFFQKQEKALLRCLDLIKIVRANNAAVKLFRAKNQKHLIENMGQYAKAEEAIENSRNSIVAMTKGKTFFGGERTFRSFSGKQLYVKTSWHVPSGYQKTLSKVYNSHVDITERKRLEEALKTRELELQYKAEKLEETNATLNILLASRTEDKKELEATTLYNVRELVLPYLEKLKDTQLNDRQKTYIGILERNLSEIMSPFLRGMSLSQLRFTPTELQVINLIKQGLSTRQMAEFFNLSKRTIECYRDNIRGKLDIKRKKINLRTYLLSKL